jgi:CubicO group peptidase (beta-lactamase class C family)
MRQLIVVALLVTFGLGALGVRAGDRQADVGKHATPAGTTFVLPAGWNEKTQGELTILAPPEPDLTVSLLDLSAKDEATAIAAAWAATNPDFKRPVHVSGPQSPRNGWEERRYIEYETSPNEKLTVRALAWRSKSNWLVALLQGSQATEEKREGPLSQLLGSILPKGYTPESFADRKAHAIDAGVIAKMNSFVAEGMRQLQIPGVAFSLIDGGKIVYEGGVGVRELGYAQPIDKNTLFIAASNTKALGTLLLAELVDQGKLRWDEPVVEAYPTFKLGDPATTRSVLVKHLVCACTGMPRQDLEWLFQDPKEMPAVEMAKLAAMQPTSHFGEVFQYSNSMAAAAGFIGGSIAEPGKELGAAYDDAMQRMVLGPLHMADSTFDFAQAMRGNYARPHDVDVDGHLAVGVMDLNYTVVPLRPAGGIWTSAHDLSQYVMMELGNGKLPNGQQLVSAKNLLERRVPNVVVSQDIDYGMGLMVDKRWGVPIVHHGGDLAGYHSDMMWFPDYNVGAVILTNSDNGYMLRGPFLRKLAELMFDGKSEAAAQLEANATQLVNERVKLRERLQIPVDAKSAAQLAPRYRNAALGPLLVTRRGSQVWMAAGKWRSEVASRKNDDGTISLITISPTLQGIEFVMTGEKGPVKLVIRDAQHEYVFEPK